MAKFSLLLLLSCWSGADAAPTREINIEAGAERYRVELATTPAERRLGLMHRERLDTNAGMLLVYPDSGDHRVWMKNMKIALRVYWISESYRVVGKQRLEPCRRSPCATYSVPTDSRFVLELSDREHAIEIGDLVEGINDL